MSLLGTGRARMLRRLLMEQNIDEREREVKKLEKRVQRANKIGICILTRVVRGRR